MLKNILVLLLSSVIFVLLWFAGLEKIYANVLVFFANVILAILSTSTSLNLMVQEGELVIIVTTVLKGVQGTFPQKLQSLLLPTVILLSWLPVLFLHLTRRSAILQSLKNAGVFFLLQILFMLILSSYYHSAVSRYLFYLFIEAFYIMAIIIIIKDALKYPYIWKQS